jgi:WD40 repeat protein
VKIGLWGRPKHTLPTQKRTLQLTSMGKNAPYNRITFQEGEIIFSVMKLSKNQRKRLRKAIEDEYRSRRELRRFLREELGIDINKISPETSTLEESVFDLIERAESKGNLTDLLQALLDKTSNQKSQGIYRELLLISKKSRSAEEGVTSPQLHKLESWANFLSAHKIPSIDAYSISVESSCAAIIVPETYHNSRSRLYICDLSGEFQCDFVPLEYRPRLISLSPDIKKIFLSGENIFDDLRIIDRDGSEIIKIPSNSVFDCLAWSRNSRYIAVSHRALPFSSTSIWDLDSRREVSKLQGYSWNINSLEFTQCNQYIFSTGIDGLLRKWSVRSGQCLDVVNHRDIADFTFDFSSLIGKFLSWSGFDAVPLKNALLLNHDSFVCASHGMSGEKELMKIWSLQNREERIIDVGHHSEIGVVGSSLIYCLSSSKRSIRFYELDSKSTNLVEKYSLDVDLAVSRVFASPSSSTLFVTLDNGCAYYLDFSLEMH